MPETRAAADPAPDVAAAVREAGFVRIVARADGDALAAAGLLAAACHAAGVPFQARATPDPATAAGTGDRAGEGHADERTVLLGGTSAAAAAALPGDGDRTASAAAFEVAASLGAEPDPALALAGAVAGGAVPGEDGTAPALEAATEGGRVDRRPGISVPTADLADGLAHTALALAPFSGDRSAATAALEERGLPTDRAALGDAAPDDAASTDRAVASLLAIEVATAEGATPRAASSVERALRPYAIRGDAPFATVGGYADVLDAVAREAPGTGVALALGHDEAREAALTAWREHARAVHEDLRDATTGRYDGLFVARLDAADPGRLRTAARLVRDFRSPEPVALAVGDGAAAAASVEPRDLGAVVGDAADAVGGTGHGRQRRGEARFEADVSAFVTAFREAIR